MFRQRSWRIFSDNGVQNSPPLAVTTTGSLMPGSNVEFATGRITLVSALSWRAIAELFRRYHPAYSLRVTQIHPGISTRGTLELTSVTSEMTGPARLTFNLGGPSGTYRVHRSHSQFRPDGAGPQDLEFARPMLSGDPSSVIDEIAAAWGLPRAIDPLVSSSKTTITIRVIAGLMERLVFARESWRTTAGFCGNDAAGDMVPDWLAALGVDEALRRRALEGADLNAMAGLTRYILVHQCLEDSLCLHINELRGTAWAFDIAAATATELKAGGPGRTINLLPRYIASKRDLRSLVGELESALP